MKKIIYLTFLFSLCLYSCKNKNKGTKISPKVTDITETVYGSIKIRPAISYFPQAIPSGIIKEVLVNEGDKVLKGQILFQISIPMHTENSLSNAKLNLAEAKANYNGANNLLINIETEIQSLEEQFVLDSTNFKRLERLWAQDVGMKIDFDKAEFAYKNTRNQLSILRKTKAQTLITLKNNYQKAINQTKTEHSQFDDYTIRSEMDGVVYSVNKEVGDFINSQENFGEIGSANDFIINMDIDEEDIIKINLKDSVIIALDAYPEKVFVANVSKIYPKKEESTQTFLVESRFYPPIPKLYHGFSGEANILVDKKLNTMVIPSEYLMAANQVQTEDGVVSVGIGIKNLEYAEVLSGIDTTTILLKPSE